MVKTFTKENGDGERVIDFDKVKFAMDISKLIAMVGAVITVCTLYFRFESKCENHMEYDWNVFHQERYAKVMRDQNEYKVKVPNAFEIKAQVDAEHKR